MSARKALALLLAAAVATGAVITARAVLGALIEAEYLCDDLTEDDEEGVFDD